MAVRVVIAGCGFGGLEAAHNLKRMLKDRVEITAIDRDERFEYVPGLPGLASGRKGERDVTIPYVGLFNRIRSRFVNSEIKSIDRKGRTVITAKGEIPYDYLIVSLGSDPAYYGIKGAKENSLGFRSVADANALRDHIVEAFGSQRGVPPDSIDRAALRIVVVGGGLSGVELITELKTLADDTCKREGLPRNRCDLVLIDHGPILHPSFDQEVGEFVEQYFSKCGIRLQHGHAVTEVRKGEVLLDDGTAIRAETVVWCAGIMPSGVVCGMGGGCVNPKYGLMLNSYLQVVDDPNVFSIGDCSYSKIFEAAPILTALRATEQAEYVSANLFYEVTGRRDKMVVYEPRRFPTLISLCRGMGILEFGGFWSKGRVQWWMKRATQSIYMARFRHNLGFLEYVDELFIDLIESWYSMRMRRR